MSHFLRWVTLTHNDAVPCPLTTQRAREHGYQRPISRVSQSRNDGHFTFLCRYVRKRNAQRAEVGRAWEDLAVGVSVRWVQPSEPCQAVVAVARWPRFRQLDSPVSNEALDDKATRCASPGRSGVAVPSSIANWVESIARRTGPRNRPLTSTRTDPEKEAPFQPTKRNKESCPFLACARRIPPARYNHRFTIHPLVNI